jgi:SnoaL-like domain
VDVQSAARRWAETWERAWPTKQSAEIAALYHEAATYRSSPFREAEAGGALAYVESQFTAEEAVECRFAQPIAAGDRAAVEWWASFIEAGQTITLAGATVLRFDSAGLVVDHVDYWVQSQGRTVPYAGWREAGHFGDSKGTSLDD